MSFGVLVLLYFLLLLSLSVMMSVLFKLPCCCCAVPFAAAASAASAGVVPRCSLKTSKVYRHLSVARELQNRANAVSARTAAATLPVLLLDESYSTWRALRKRQQRASPFNKSGRQQSSERQVDSAAAAELLDDLIAAAAAPDGPTHVMRLGVSPPEPPQMPS